VKGTRSSGCQCDTMVLTYFAPIAGLARTRRIGQPLLHAPGEVAMLRVLLVQWTASKAMLDLWELPGVLQLL
jgi:hypothetical protein